jgi:hypothetical protein
MKDTTAHSLIVARALYDQAAALCTAEDRHLATAGIVVLQDVLELVFYALLIELGIDEAKSLESKSFDELVAEMKKAGIAVPKSGALKALNKQRVLAKHYAQLAEPATVRGYFDAASIALASVVAAVTGKPLSEIYMAGLLEAGETREYLQSAEALIDATKYLDALVEIRKGLFVEFEHDYSVHGWRDYEGQNEFRGLGSFGRGGWKAPYWTQNKKWVDEHVSDPLDYIQIDFDRWRVDALEWGINTAELHSIRNLTPSVFRAEEGATWCIRYDAAFLTSAATLENAKYCLDRAIAVILKKQQHIRAHKGKGSPGIAPLPNDYVGENLYQSASVTSKVVHVVSDHFEYSVSSLVDGLDSSGRFFRVIAMSRERTEKGFPKNMESGFLRVRES